MRHVAHKSYFQQKFDILHWKMSNDRDAILALQNTLILPKRKLTLVTTSAPPLTWRPGARWSNLVNYFI